MNWKKFFHSIGVGLCWYMGIYIFAILFSASKYTPPTFDSGDILIGLLILGYAIMKGTK